jgi:hypothetical protein
MNDDQYRRQALNRKEDTASVMPLWSSERMQHHEHVQAQGEETKDYLGAVRAVSKDNYL